MSKHPTMHRYGFFHGSSLEADVAELVTAVNGETMHTNALAQCIAVETADETGKRTLSHISPFDDDNPMRTEDQEKIAGYWTERILEQHEGRPESIKAILAGGRKGHPLSEQLHKALLTSFRKQGIEVYDKTNILQPVAGRTITNVSSGQDSLKVNIFSDGQVRRQGFTR